MKFKKGDLVVITSNDRFNGKILTVYDYQVYDYQNDSQYAYVLGTPKNKRQYGAREEQIELATKLHKSLL